MRNYVRSAAVRYAVRWALDRNPMYYDYGNIGGDCTNFASQCLYAGSGIMDYTQDLGWYYIDANLKAPAWTGVEFLYQYLTRSNLTPGPRAEISDAGSILPGDVIQLSFDGVVFSHTLIVLRVYPTILVAAHSEDSLFRPLDSYDYQIARYLHISDVVTDV